MTVTADSKKLAPGALVDLYILDLNPIGIGIVRYFHPGSDENLQPVHFQGQDYQPLPVTIEGLEKRGSGSEKRPTVTISNINGLLSNEVQVYDDLVGAHVIRRRTFAQYLGTETVDSSAYAEEIYIIEQKTKENGLLLEFELASAMDFVDHQIPARIMVANACPWQYKSTENGSGCGWPGIDASKWFDRTGTQVFTQIEDDCGKRLQDCKLRFGANNPLDFGGFPSLGRV